MGRWVGVEVRRGKMVRVRAVLASNGGDRCCLWNSSLGLRCVTCE